MVCVCRCFCRCRCRWPRLIFKFHFHCLSTWLMLSMRVCVYVCVHAQCVHSYANFASKIFGNQTHNNTHTHTHSLDITVCDTNQGLCISLEEVLFHFVSVLFVLFELSIWCFFQSEFRQNRIYSCALMYHCRRTIRFSRIQLDTFAL